MIPRFIAVIVAGHHAVFEFEAGPLCLKLDDANGDYLARIMPAHFSM